MKTPKAKIDLTGKSIQDIMNLDIDINKLSRGDLSRVVGRLVSASNKRIRRLEKTSIGKLSPAYQSRMKHGGQFSTKPIQKLPSQQQTNALRQLFGETKGFLELKTSTTRGWKDLRTGIADKLGIDLDTETKAKRFWKAYREITESQNIPSKNVRSRYNSERIQELLATQYNMRGGFNQRRSDVIEKVNQKITEIYEEEQKEQYDVSDYDDWDDIE